MHSITGEKIVMNSSNSPTQPVQTSGDDPLSQYQPIRLPPKKNRVSGFVITLLGFGCVALLGLLVLYLLFPARTNFLILGIDRPPAGTNMSRTDTMIVVTVNPLKPDIGMLSIPRDLWVAIPGHGENRINTAHFFAEIDHPGSGPAAAQAVVQRDFHVTVPYYVRVRFDSVTDIVDAMGGVDIELKTAMSGYDPGWHHLNGKQALAFVRDRKGSDDFFRMSRGQMFIMAAVRQMINPLNWWRVPLVAVTSLRMVDTNIPAWQLPRIGVAFMRGLVTGIDAKTLTRDMVTPTITDQGADVLLPNWQRIYPLVKEIFG
jgi:polyisoprenyl-teichoic acid--peptidoglycan teichoic acid transferase